MLKSIQSKFATCIVTELSKDVFQVVAQNGKMAFATVTNSNVKVVFHDTTVATFAL